MYFFINKQNLQKEVGSKKKNLEDLLQIIQEISAESPEARLKTHTSQITTRYQALERSIQVICKTIFAPVHFVSILK